MSNRLERGLKTAMGATLRSKAKVPADQILSLDSSDGWNIESIGMSTDRAMKISTVNRCVEVLSNSMAVLPIYLMNEHSYERLPKHRLGKVLWERPNEDMTPFDMWGLMLRNEILKGNGYAWICRSPSSGEVEELLPLPPDCVTIHIDRDGTLWYLYCCPRTGNVWRVDQEDMLHYKAYSKDGIEGISVLARAAQTMTTAEAAERHQTAIYQNGGRPSGVLAVDADLSGSVTRQKPDGTTETVGMKDLVRQEWEKVHRGADNAMRIAVLDHGLKYQPISMSNSDAQFVESSEIRVADLCRFFGVPLHLAYAGKQSYSSNEQNGIEFVKYTLLGYETQWKQEDSYKLLFPSERAAGIRIKRELKVFLQGDTAAQAAWYRAMREIGAYNADEIRALDDRPPVPGGDDYYASWNYGPLARWAELSIIRALGRAVEEDKKNE